MTTLTNTRLNIFSVKFAWVFSSALIMIGCSSPLKYEPRAQKPLNSTSVENTVSTRTSDCKTNYQIRSGETLSGIAQKCGVSQTLLAELNGINRPDKIYIGQWLKIPQNHLEDSSSKNFSPNRNRQTVTSVKTPVGIKKEIYSAGKNHWQWPTDKSIPHRWLRDANGVTMLEVEGRMGDSIKAVDDGVVVYADNGIREFGNMVMVRHASGKLSVYAHASEILVIKNAQVIQGQEIAKIGASGMTTKPKLHLEARYLGKKIQLKPLLVR